MDRYNIKKPLGQGTWGVVHMAEQKETGRLVAIKRIKSERKEEGINFTAVREIKLLRELKHENIIELVDCFPSYETGAVCLVYELAYTDLSHILRNMAIPLSLADIKRHMLSLLRAVEGTFCWMA
jgi:cyclin-dependent kinase 7